tara:strand:+ start:1228 stop:2109 length:882 start_codon:yes stop_codon:yes gene_type:complete
MTENEEERSFEDHFDELAGDVPTPPAEMSIPDEPEEGEEYAHDQGQEEEKEEEQAGVLEPEPEPEPEAESSAESLSVEEQLAAARAELQKATHKYNSDLGRQNAYQRQIKERDQMIADMQKQLAQATPVQSDTMQEDYPDIAQATDGRIGRALAPLQQEIARLKSELDPLKEHQSQTWLQSQFAALEAEHPDWAQIAQSPEFNDWSSRQPPEVKAMLDSEEADRAIYILRAFKNDVMPAQPQANSELKQRREKQLRQAQNVPSRGGRSQQNMPPENDFDAAFDYFADLDERRN